MAVVLLTVNMWFAIGVSVIFLLAFATVLMYCTCWLKNRRKTTQLYVVEDLDFKKRSFLEIASTFNIYRRFNSVENDDNKLLNDDVDTNLLDSVDESNKFTNSLLRINSQADELRSCISTDSLGTFYSTNVSRSNSKRTFVSCSEGSDIGDIV